MRCLPFGLLLAWCLACGATPPPPPDGGADAGSSNDAGLTTDAGQPPLDAGIDAGPPPRVLEQYWANTQWPPWLTLAVGESATVYGQVWVQGGTEAAGAMPDLEAELGVGALGSAPASWAWTRATFNVEAGNNDEFKATLVATTPGTFEYAFRYRVRGAHFGAVGEWLSAGVKGPTLAAGEAGLLAVKAPGASVKVATQNLACVRDDPSTRFDALVTRWAALGTDVIALQEVCDEAPLGNTAQLLAQRLGARTGRPWRHVFTQTHLANGTTPEGLGLLSALPVATTAEAALPTQEFPRRALLGVIATPVGMLAATSTHFSFRPEDAAFREQQAQAVLQLAGAYQGSAQPPGTALLVAGDFNTTPDTAPPRVFTQTTPAFLDAWAEANPGQPGYSYPLPAPTVRIDYLLVRGLSVHAATQEFTQPYAGSSVVSDHAGFAAELR